MVSFATGRFRATSASSRSKPIAERPDPDSGPDHDEKIEELFLIAMCRRPTAEEASALIGYVERKTTGENANARQAYEDVMWMLLNTKEFLFNH